MSLVNNPKVDKKIIRSQKNFHILFDKHFTFNKSLGFSILAGTISAFIGSDCYGGIAISSPLSVLVIASVFFSLIQVGLFIKLSMIRIIKFFTVLLSTCLLVKESFALYSVNLMKFPDACQPYLYANTPIGYLWIVAPMLFIIGWCFTGNSEERLNDHLKSEADSEILKPPGRMKMIFHGIGTKMKQRAGLSKSEKQLQ